MSEELDFNAENKLAFNIFTKEFITASQLTPGMIMMSIDEIGEWILGATGVEISNYDLNAWLVEFGYNKTTVSNTIMWMVSPVD